MIQNIKNLSSSYHVAYEAGRMLSADCGFYVARIEEIKHRVDCSYIVLNGGSHHFTYYNRTFNLGKNRTPQISIVSNVVSLEKKTYTIVGALCSAGDILVKEITFEEPHVGDYIIFHNAGAYCSTEGMTLFLSRDVPAIYLVEDSKCSLFRNRFQIGEGGEMFK
jgi:diaminopimelate decarboxylase